MRKRGTIPMLIGLLLMAAALLLTIYNYWDSNRAGEAAQEVLVSLQEELPKELHPASDRTRPTVYLPEATEPEVIPEMPTQERGGYYYIGVLTVPCFDLQLPIMNEWNYKRLETAPCRYSGSYFTNDLVLCGHNYNTHFAHLKGIDLGEDIYLTTVDGFVYHYVVDNVETVNPTEIDRMLTGDWDLTLFTCHTGGRTRCAVRCVLADE